MNELHDCFHSGPGSCTDAYWETDDARTLGFDRIYVIALYLYQLHPLMSALTFQIKPVLFPDRSAIYMVSAVKFHKKSLNLKYNFIQELL